MYNFVPFKKSDKFQIDSFIQVPRELLEREEYKSLTPNAIVLFSVLADRLRMSFLQIDKNSKIQFYDNKGEMYVIFKRDEIQEEVHLNRTALANAIKLLKDCNLIREKKQGRNLPNLIYVGKTIGMMEESKILDFRNVQNQHSIMHKTYTPDCIKPALHNSNNKYKNNNIYNNFNTKTKTKANFEQREYSSEELEKLYCN